MGLGSTELIVILIIALVIFGPSRLPGLGKSMGEAIRGFKKGLEDDDKNVSQQQQASYRISDADSAPQKQSEKESHKS